MHCFFILRDFETFSFGSMAQSEHPKVNLLSQRTEIVLSCHTEKSMCIRTYAVYDIIDNILDQSEVLGR